MTILINGNTNLSAIDVTEPVRVEWQNPEVAFDHIVVSISDASQTIAQKTIDKGYFVDLDLAIVGERVRLSAELQWQGWNGVVMHKESVTFYTASYAIQTAQWITRLDNPIEREFSYYDDKPTMIFTKQFNLNKSVKKAFIDIAGLGYYKLNINGHSVGEFELNSDVTVYRRRVYYDTYRVESLLQKGNNTISVELGNGWFNPAPIRMIRKYNVRDRMRVGFPCLAVNFEVYDGAEIVQRLTTDASWQAEDGEEVFNNIYIGEKFVVSDKQKAVNPVVTISRPAPELRPSFIPKVKMTTPYQNYQLVQSRGAGQIVDFGRIVTGFLSFDVDASFTGTIKVNYAERLKDGDLDQRSTIPGSYGKNSSGIPEDRAVLQEDVIDKQSDQAYHFTNRFAYHTFRYIKISGASIDDLTQIKATSVHTELVENTQFNSSDQQLNALWQAANQTKRNNIHSYYEDCARERLGYGGDDAVLADSQVYAFHSKELIRKVWHDFILDQTETGGVTQTAPYMGIKSNGTSDKAGSLGWQQVLSVYPLALNKYYGVEVFSKEEITAVQKFANYLLAFSYDYVKHCCLGDWGAFVGQFVEGRAVPPDQLFEGAVMYYMNLQQLAQLLLKGNMQAPSLREKLLTKMAAVKEQINTEFYHDGVYGSGSQSAYAYALTADIVPLNDRKRVESAFVQLIETSGFFSTGIFGMKMTYDLLTGLQRDDLIWKWLKRTEKPSFNSMLKLGNQTLSEYFDLVNGSCNHAMFSSYTKWMVNRLGGLTIQNATHFSFEPYLGQKVRVIDCRIGSLANVHLEWVDGEIQGTLRWDSGVSMAIAQTEIEQQGFRIVENSRTDTELMFTLQPVPVANNRE